MWVSVGGGINEMGMGLLDGRWDSWMGDGLTRWAMVLLNGGRFNVMCGMCIFFSSLYLAFSNDKLQHINYTQF